jgi:hypothetical protein
MRTHEEAPAASEGETTPRRGKAKLSREAKSRLLDGSDLSRYEIGSKHHENSERREYKDRRDHNKDHKDRHDFRTKRNHDDRRGNRRPSQRKHHG